MAYATEADVTALYGDEYKLVAVDRNDDGEADTPPLPTALASATSEIDSYLGKVYTLPLDLTTPSPHPTAELLKTACIDIAIYRLDPDRSVLTDEKIKRYERWIAWLRDVAKGIVVLPSVDQDGDPLTGPEPARMISEERVMTRTKLGGLW